MRTVSLAVALACAASAGAQLSTTDFLSGLKFRAIGPATMSGRIADIDVDPRDNAVIYVATASGGVWKSSGNGVTWTPIFDDAGAASIGCVQVSRADSSVVWVGSGESNNRNSSAWGDGVYKSTDAGKTWTNMGLASTQQIARIVTHPKDANRAWVAAIGPLWNASPDRGVFMTEDGGKSWKKTLFTDDNTGCTELVMDPSNPNTLYAGMYERRRFPNTFRSGGKSGGVYKSTDAGKSWTKLTNGLPKGDTGKIGLAVYPKNPRIVYAMIEADKGRTTGVNEDGLYRSEDAGRSWKRQGTFSSRPFYYYEITIDPTNDLHLWSTDTVLKETKDGGKTWQNQRIGTHVDFHACWVDPNNPRHLWVGNDGGVAETWDSGQSWRFMAAIPVCQFYAVAADMGYPYHVYGGLQDNGSWGGPSLSRNRRGIANYDWYNTGGGDGFHCQVDTQDNETIYSESQGGAISRFNKRTGESKGIRPRAPEGERYRFNWSSPIVLSPHNPRIVWFGGNKLFKSMDRGDNWRVASPDLTTNNPDKNKPMEGLTPENTGAETHCTIITIAESPIKPGYVWVGTDDGLVQVSQNDGYAWENVTDNITDVPKGTWVSRVEASHFKLERCYASFDGHRSGDMKPYVMVTDDFGKTWTNITANLPPQSVYVVKEDPVNENLLYVGTEFGLYVSADKGKSWNRWKTNLPTVAVHDLVIHPREREIILATHGRGMFIAPLEPLQQATPQILTSDFALFDMIEAVRWVSDSSGGYGDGEGWFYGPNPPYGARIPYTLNVDAKEVKLEILSADGAVVGEVASPPKSKGLNVVYWNFRTAGGGRFGGTSAAPGFYGVRLTVDGKSVTKKLSVKADPLLSRDP
jgi:photosystem II stability/assembly factor-like uncharacterized protein